MTVDECRIIELPKILDPRGNLTFVEEHRHIPFDIKRVFYLYDVPGGETRAGHANRGLQQFIVAMSGSFDVVVEDGFNKKTFSLNRSYFGLYLPGMVWREINNFSSGAVCLVLCDEYYDADDYYRDYEEWLRVVRGE
jgi:dTDP-4-dehydrorhamnose 3,5-epimerase-like enzyme